MARVNLPDTANASTSMVDGPEPVSKSAPETAISGTGLAGAVSLPEGQAPKSNEERAASQQDVRRERIDRFTKRFDDPEMRLDLIERGMERIDRRYSKLFQQLDLSPDAIDALKTMMSERQLYEVGRAHEIFDARVGG